MATSTLTSKGQITVPKAVRERLGLRAGDVLDFRFEADGRLVVDPQLSNPLRAAGVLRHLAGEKPVSVAEMREAIVARARRRR